VRESSRIISAPFSAIIAVGVWYPRGNRSASRRRRLREDRQGRSTAAVHRPQPKIGSSFPSSRFPLMENRVPISPAFSPVPHRRHRPNVGPRAELSLRVIGARARAVSSASGCCGWRPAATSRSSPVAMYSARSQGLRRSAERNAHRGRRGRCRLQALLP